ncbi:unnamed protein product [Calypogeia fissa]
MEVRWATTTVRGLTHSGSMQAFVTIRGRATVSPMPSNRFCVCWSSPGALFSAEDWVTGRNIRNRNSKRSNIKTVPGFRTVHSASARNENGAAGSHLHRDGKKKKVRVLRHSLGNGDSSSSSRFNDILVLKGVHAFSSSVGRGDGPSSDQTNRTKASSDASSSQPTSPTSPSASSSSSSSSTTNATNATNATPNATTTTVTPTKQQPGLLRSIISLPGSIWRQLVLPLGNFGFGKVSVWEGGVGLFVLSGALLLGVTLIWVKGVQIRSRSRKYEAVIEFARAQGITVGTPVRIRGVDVGSVVAMRPSLERIDVVVQVADQGIVIPRNSLVENNQCGLIAETMIDIMPRDPLPQPTVGPLDSACSEEGLIVCDKERIKGVQGVSMDELVGICTKLARQMDDLGMGNMYELAERVTAAIDDAKPLLAKVEVLAGDVEPLLKELRDGFLLKDLEKLTKVVTEAGHDLRTLNKSVLTAENTELLRQSVVTLTKTLNHIECISHDVSGLTGDANTKKNLRQLIQSLSRLIRD